jgi:hypothetical protein
LTRRPDPIMDEIRRIRDEYAASFDYDLKRIVHDIQRQQRESGREFVTLPPRKPTWVPVGESTAPYKPETEGGEGMPEES